MSEQRIAETSEQLTVELHARGLHLVVGQGVPHGQAPQLPSARLLSALSCERDARLRAALIALLLFQPELATDVPEALSQLTPEEQANFKLYYTAAVTVQDAHARSLRRHLPGWKPLPDLFAAELGLSSEEDEHKRLDHLEELQRQLSGQTTNWAGMVRATAERLVSRLRKESLWTAWPRGRSGTSLSD